MYLMVETVRVQAEDDRPEWRAARDAFRNELGALTPASLMSQSSVIPTTSLI